MKSSACRRRSESAERTDRDRDLGQATAEYALVLLGAAAIALILLGWATGSGGLHISGLFDRVLGSITGHTK